MHEMSLALSIVDIATKYALQAKASKVNEIEIEIGKFSGVELDALMFALNSTKSKTIIENARIKVVTIDGKAKCLNCGSEFDLDSFLNPCPNCNDFKIDIISGRELRIKSLYVD